MKEMKKPTRKLICLLAVLAMLLCMVPFQAVPANAAQNEGTFTVCSMNVDGLPKKILFVTLNGDGPGSDGTKKISAKMATYGWDIIAVSEDFNYHTELMSSLTDYNCGTHGGKVSGLSNSTDGLNLIWKKSVTTTGETRVKWKDNYASGTFGTGNGADTMITKGFRFYQCTVADGVTVDVYTLHMDADSDAEDIAARESQLKQLAAAIKASNNGNPIIVMGDTNCRYTRENLQTLFIDSINADERFTIQDAWIEKVREGNYPEHGAESIVAQDKGGTYPYPDAEIVDKIFYINNSDSKVQISADYYLIAENFVDSDGIALADHWPVVVQFSYSITPDHVHSYAASGSQNATCEENGYVTYRCSCGDSYTETIPAIGHDYDNGKVTTTAGCESEGVKTFTCANCGDTYTESIPATGHDYDNGKVTAAAGCESEGVKTFTCANCGDTYTESIPAIGHDYDNGKVTTAAGCESEGVKTFTCANCGDTYTESIPATGHDYVKTVEAATCEKDGLNTFTCSHCGDSYTEVIPAIGHNYVKTVKNATCEEAGANIFTCSYCGDSYSETIAATGHSYSTSIQQPTCEKDGATIHTCIHCGDSYSETIAAIGHNYVKTVKNATCEEAGANIYTCEHCSDSYSETIPALGHSYVDGFCENCGGKELTGELKLGSEVKSLTSGKKYAIVFYSTSGDFSLNHRNTTPTASQFTYSKGDVVDEGYVWTIIEENGKYLISTQVDGETYYLYKTNQYYGCGYKLTLTADKDTATAWTLSRNSAGNLTLSVKVGSRNWYLRYFSTFFGWTTSFNSSGLHIFEIEES